MWFYSISNNTSIYRFFCCEKAAGSLASGAIGNAVEGFNVVTKVVIRKKVDPEHDIMLDEKKLGLRTTEFSKFLFAIKRYGYKDMPFDDILFGKLCPELGIDHSQFDNERAEDRDNIVC